MLYFFLIETLEAGTAVSGSAEIFFCSYKISVNIDCQTQILVSL